MKLNSKTRVCLTAVLIGAAMLVPASRASAQATGKVAICNSLKVITSIKEYQDLSDKSKQEMDAMNTEGNKLKAKLLDEQNQLKLLDPMSSQYNTLNQALLTDSIQADATMQMAQISQTRKLRGQKVALFTKMNDAIKTVAQAKGVSVVIADHHLQYDELDKIQDNQQFDAALLQNTILYCDPTLDITQDVILAMDTAYANSGSAPKKP